jgi:hypothetical protein
MAVIPPDAGVRMRLQTEASLVQPLQPVKPVPGDLPDLQPGQAFTARIVEPLPDNTYRALVAGRHLTLQLPEGADAGDTLELVVIDRTPRAILAQRAEPQAAWVANQPYPYAKISTAGRMIGELVLAEGEMPKPAALNRGQPLLPQPPSSAADLAPTLAKAVSQSGLFYESHQAQWVAGQRPLESLRTEPQGQLPATPHPAAGQKAVTQQAGTGSGAGETDTAPAPAVMAEGAKTTPQAAERAGSAFAPTAQAIPEEVRPLVQQQLDAVVTQRLAWHGEAWPGQGIDWEIEREIGDEGREHQAGDEAPRWATTLRLTMPHLGMLDATLQLAGNSLRLQMTTATDAAAENLRHQMSELARILADAGLTLQSAEVRREAP